MTNLSFLVTGNAPFDQDGIFEAEISITEAKPTDSEIKTKVFPSIWKEKFHLKVKNGKFQETLGSADNPLPNAISSFSKVWIVVSDQFSSIGNSFEFDIPESIKSENIVSTITKSDTRKKTKTRSLQGQQGEQGDKGPVGVQGDKGDKGPTGPPGIQGDKGVPGAVGEKGDKGITGPAGDKGSPGPQGPQGEKGKIG